MAFCQDPFTHNDTQFYDPTILVSPNYAISRLPAVSHNGIGGGLDSAGGTRVQHPCNPTGHLDSATEKGSEEEDKKNPFAPECSVPLPFQMGDEYGYYGPTSVWKRNERERVRVRCVNEGYELLRDTLPLTEKDKRISKVDTLRLAIRYMRHLERIMDDAEHCRHCVCFTEPLISHDKKARKLKRKHICR